ncbi:MAG: tetratricopeptide repeat protein [Pseudomonadota bacterium]
MTPQKFELAMSEAIAAFNSGRFDLAVGICAGILRPSPDNSAAHQLLAVICMQRGDTALARQHIQTSLQFRPDHGPSLLIAGRAARADCDLAAAVGYFERAEAITPAEFEPAYLYGVTLLEYGDLAAATSVLERLVLLHPRHALAWCGFGSTLQQAGKKKAARDALEQAVALDSRLTDAWFNLGIVRQDLGDLAGSANAFVMALQYRPDYAEAAVNLGIVLQESGAADEAMDAYRRAYRLRAATFGRIANALTSSPCGRLWLDLGELRGLLAA